MNDLDYMSLGEQRMFAEAVRKGELSFFQTAACATCQKDIHKENAKKYCSEACSNKGHENANAKKAHEGDREVD